MPASSPTLRERIFSSVNGAASEIMLVEPLGDVALRVELHALTAISPAHIADADEERRRQTIRRADFHAKQSGLAAETHLTNAEFVRGFPNIPFEIIEFLHRISIRQLSQKLFLRELEETVFAR